MSSRLPLALASWVALLALGLTACTASDAPSPPSPQRTQPPEALGPCGAVVAGRQGTTALRPDTGPVRAAGMRGAGVRAFLVPEIEGVCLVLDPGTARFGWQVDAQRLSASAAGREWSWESGQGGAANRGQVGLLVVPRSGCVEVDATVRVSGPGGVAGAWTLAQPYGWDCARAPGGAGVPDS